jgi:hypothetical protein
MIALILGLIVTIVEGEGIAHTLQAVVGVDPGQHVADPGDRLAPIGHIEGFFHW